MTAELIKEINPSATWDGSNDVQEVQLRLGCTPTETWQPLRSTRVPVSRAPTELCMIQYCHLISKLSGVVQRPPAVRLVLRILKIALLTVKERSLINFWVH